MKITLGQINEWTGKDYYESVSEDTSDYSSEDLEEVATKAYLEGKREATRQWAWWKGGTQYVGSCGKTLQQALDVIAEEENV